MGEGFIDLWNALVGSVSVLFFLAVNLAVLAGHALLPFLPGGLWCAWWLWCVDWKHAWPVLARGGWLVVVLLTLITALAWAGMFPTTCRCLGFPLPNFLWQLGACSALVLVALFCGWVQGQWNLAPAAPVTFEPPASSHDHHHGHHHHGH